MSTPFSAEKISRACWRPITSHWANLPARPGSHVVAHINLISGDTTCDTNASYIWPAPRGNGEKAMTPQERQLVDDLFDRLSKVDNAPRDPDAASAIAQG